MRNDNGRSPSDSGRVGGAVRRLRRSALPAAASAAALLSGCLTGPRYTYVRQPDSALVVEAPRADEPVKPKTCEVYVDFVDGLAAPTGWYPMSGRQSDRVYVSPGRHALRFYLRYREPVVEPGGPTTKIFEALGELDSTFLPNREYFIAATLHRDTYTLRLYDATESRVKPVLLGTGDLPAEHSYSPNFKYTQAINDPNTGAWAHSVGTFGIGH